MEMMDHFPKDRGEHTKYLSFHLVDTAGIPCAACRSNKSIKGKKAKARFYKTDHMNLIAVLLLVEEILHQLRLVVYPIIYSVSYISGG